MTKKHTLLDSEDCLIILNYATRLLALDLKRETLLERGLEALSDFSANRNVALFTRQESERHLCLEGIFKNRRYQALRRKVPGQGTPLEEVISNMEYGIYPSSTGSDFPMPAFTAPGGNGRCLCLPLVGAGNKAVGVVAIADPVGGHPTPKELQLLIILTTMIAVSLENSYLIQIATRDGLTDLYIRTIFEIRLREELARLKRHGGVFSILMTDVDQFKGINDQYGHSGGDAVLKELAVIFKRYLRADVDLVFRYGGDEFMTIMVNTGAAEAMKIARRIHEQCAVHTFLAPEAAVTVTISSGLLTVSDTGNLNEKDLIGKVDKLLYEAKHRGKNQICAES